MRPGRPSLRRHLFAAQRPAERVEIKHPTPDGCAVPVDAAAARLRRRESPPPRFSPTRVSPSRLINRERAQSSLFKSNSRRSLSRAHPKYSPPRNIAVHLSSRGFTLFRRTREKKKTFFSNLPLRRLPPLLFPQIADLY